jgi:hypothetical protein
MQAAHRGAAGKTLAQVDPQIDDLRGVALPVDEGRQRRREALALAARLDPRVALQEALAPLRQATVDLRIASQTTGRGDLCAPPSSGLATTPPLLLDVECESDPAAEQDSRTSSGAGAC